MPLYEYECPICGRFDVLQKMSDKPLVKCPNCAEKGKKSKVTRAVSAPSFHLKGSGWYKTDYASSSSSSGSKAKTGSKAKEDNGKGSSDTKTSDSTDKKALAA